MVGLNEEAVEVVFDGDDGPVFDKTPDLVKSLPVWKAIEETTLVAYEMNGEPLPHWNGFPARIVAPGWTATYWVKHITSITAVTKPFELVRYPDKCVALCSIDEIKVLKLRQFKAITSINVKQNSYMNSFHNVIQFSDLQR